MAIQEVGVLRDFSFHSFFPGGATSGKVIHIRVAPSSPEIGLEQHGEPRTSIESAPKFASMDFSLNSDAQPSPGSAERPTDEQPQPEEEF